MSEKLQKYSAEEIQAANAMLLLARGAVQRTDENLTEEQVDPQEQVLHEEQISPEVDFQVEAQIQPLPPVLPSTSAEVQPAAAMQPATALRPSAAATQPTAPNPPLIPFFPQLHPGQQRTAANLFPLIKAMYQPDAEPDSEAESEETRFIRLSILWDELTDTHLLSVAEALVCMGPNAGLRDAIWYLEESEWDPEIAAQYYNLDLLDRTNHPLTHADPVVPQKREQDDDDDDEPQTAKKNWSFKNTKIDRGLAFAGDKFDPSKLRFEIKQNTTKKFKFENPASFDKKSPSAEHVKLLNIWRREILRKEVGPEITKRRSGRLWSSLELKWIKNRFTYRFDNDRTHDTITNEFNDNFAGAYLPGAANACDTRTMGTISGCVNKYVSGPFKKTPEGVERVPATARELAREDRKAERKRETKAMLADLNGDGDEGDDGDDEGSEDDYDEDESSDDDGTGDAKQDDANRSGGGDDSKMGDSNQDRSNNEDGEGDGKCGSSELNTESSSETTTSSNTSSDKAIDDLSDDESKSADGEGEPEAEAEAESSLNTESSSETSSSSNTSSDEEMEG